MPWRLLNISIDDALRRDFDFNEFYRTSQFKDKPQGIWNLSYNRLPELFNNNWLMYMKDLDLEISNCLIFFRKSGYFRYEDKHIDILPNKKIAIYALNWVVNPNDDSEMVWYNMVDDQGVLDINPAKADYVSWTVAESESAELARHCVGSRMTLINIGLPHNVIMGNLDRWCISVRLHKAELFKNWDETVNAFKEFMC